MKVLRMVSVLCVAALCFVGCKKKETEGDTGKKATANKVAVVKLDDIKAMKFDAKGWHSNYNKALDSWDFEDKGYDSKFYVGMLEEGKATKVDEFAKGLQEKDYIDWGFVWSEIKVKESFDGGWVIKGTQKDYDSGDTEPAVMIYLAKYNLLCRSSSLKSDAHTNDMIAICKSISF